MPVSLFTKLAQYLFAIITNFLFIFREECEAIGELAGIEGTDVYCHRQCMVYPVDNCPMDKCKCYTTNDLVTTYPEENDNYLES